LMNRNNNNYYFHQNQLGSTMAITGNNAALMESYQYDPFGKVSFLDANGNPISQSGKGNTILFTGRSYDDETGNYDYRARTMQPSFGRFMQPDPLIYLDGMNYYSYVNNNPVIFGDAFGLAARVCRRPLGDGTGFNKWMFDNSEWNKESTTNWGHSQIIYDDGRNFGYGPTGTFSEKVNEKNYICDGKYFEDEELLDKARQNIHNRQSNNYRGNENDPSKKTDYDFCCLNCQNYTNEVGREYDRMQTRESPMEKYQNFF